LLATARARLSWQLTPLVGLVAGPTANLLVSSDPSYDPDLAGPISRSVDWGDHGRAWVGLLAGLQL
jgi:hypothetical protein